MIGQSKMAKPNVVVTRTPLRVSFLGGGSDTAEFYQNHGQGQVISLALNKYIYVVIKRHAAIFDEQYRLSYSQNEICGSLDDIQNNVIRECIRFSGIKEPLYISTFSDIPAASGLGSSSSLAVGLLNGLHALNEEPVTRNILAEEACDIEINKLNQPIGKQDQYAAAFGGLNRYIFNADGSVDVRGTDVSPDYLSNVLNSSSLFWTGLTRNVGDILSKQKTNFSDGKLQEVSMVAELVPEFVGMLEKKAPITNLAQLVASSWELKKRFADTISNSFVDTYYDNLIKAGGYGGKLCGGGGGGFVLMFHEANKAPPLVIDDKATYSFKLGMDFSGSEILMVN